MIFSKWLHLFALVAVIKCCYGGFTYPGTKWCGPGNSATNYDDLGRLRDEDICCRAHDRCPDNIKAGRRKHGLWNTSLYTRSNCDCDDELRRCLRATGPKVSTIGYLYFALFPQKCFRNDYPVTGCNKRGGFLKLKCLEPVKDTSKPKEYQWFDVPAYNSN